MLCSLVSDSNVKTRPKLVVILEPDLKKILGFELRVPAPEYTFGGSWELTVKYDLVCRSKSPLRLLPLPITFPVCKWVGHFDLFSDTEFLDEIRNFVKGYFLPLDGDSNVSVSCPVKTLFIVNRCEFVPRRKINNVNLYRWKFNSSLYFVYDIFVDFCPIPSASSAETSRKVRECARDVSQLIGTNLQRFLLTGTFLREKSKEFLIDRDEPTVSTLTPKYKRRLDESEWSVENVEVVSKKRKETYSSRRVRRIYSHVHWLGEGRVLDDRWVSELSKVLREGTCDPEYRVRKKKISDLFSLYFLLSDLPSTMKKVFSAFGGKGDVYIRITKVMYPNKFP